MKTKFIPLYERIANEIRIKIQTGKYKAGDRLPTEHELMATYNVSRITASKAVNVLVDEGLIQRSRKIGTFVKNNQTDSIQNSYPEIIPDGISQRKMFPIVMPFTMTNGLNLVDGINKYNTDNKFYFVPYNSDNQYQNERDILSELINYNPPGLICNPIVSKNNISYFSEFIKRKIPLIFIDHGVYGIQAPCVTSDNYNIAYEVTQRLIQLGHTKIAFAATNSKLETIEMRFKGYLTALLDNSMSLKQGYFLDLKSNNSAHDLLVSDDPASFDLPSNFKKLMENEEPPTAIICSNDSVAIHIERLAIANGYSIPDDISIVGFDNTDLCDCMSVPITSVAQNYSQFGSEALFLFNRLRVNVSVPDKTLVPASIVWRDSVKNFTNINFSNNDFPTF